jgi:DNA-binding winged helix-turn-helix (wHTH) protein/tetratricopeptide (TPR) repeat protein/TolB-like protein
MGALRTTIAFASVAGFVTVEALPARQPRRYAGVMTRTFLRFGDGHIDVAARELWRGDRRIDLPPTVFDCIAYLATHRDRAVGRDELVAAVWGKTAVSDTMLGKAILAARRATGDTAGAQAILRTVPRYGYRWVAPTAEVAADAPAMVVAAVPTTAPPAGRPATAPQRRRTALAVLAAAVVAALATGWFGARQAPETAPPRAEATTAGRGDAIAVLPAEVLAGSDDDWLRLGLMDLIATRLRARGVAVMPSDSVVRVVAGSQGRDDAQRRLSGAAAVRSLVLPAVRRSGKDWVVRAELVDVGGARRTVQVEGESPITATDRAARRLLALLGHAQAGDAPADTDIGLTELLQRTDAARLADNLELARTLVEQAPPVLRDLPEVRERVIRIDLRAGRFDAARAAIAALLARVSVESEPVMHARLLENLCVAELRSGRLAQARHACDEAIGLLDGRGEPIALGRAYNDRGILEAREGHADAALADFSRSRVAITLGGDPLLLAQLDGNESTVQMTHGRPAEALPTLVRAGETFRRFGMANEYVTSLVNQIGSHLQLLQPLDALEASDAGWAERARVTDPQVRSAFEAARADALAANGRIAEARSVLDALIQRTAPPADPGQAARARAIEARLDLALGDAGTAAVLARAAVGALDGTGDEADRADAWLTLARALQVTDAGAAREQASAFAAWAKDIDDPRVRVRADLARAATADDAATATAAFEAALAGVDGRSELVAEAAVAYGNALVAQGRLDAAAIVAGRVARAAGQDFDCALLQARLYHALGQDAAWRGALAHARELAGERPIPQALQRLAPAAE